MALRILVLEDDPVQQRAVRLLLAELGYTVVGVAATADEGLRLFAEQLPDMVILDIRLAGATDGITLAGLLNRVRPVPLIFLTSFGDSETFARAQEALPYAYLIKPPVAETLHHAIELAVRHFARNQGEAPEPGQDLPTDDGCFLRENGRFVRVSWAEVLWLEADGSYCHLHTREGRKHTVRLTLRQVENRLPAPEFVRVHRTFAVRRADIISLDPQAGEVTLRGGAVVPLGPSFRDDLLNGFNLLS